MAGYDETDFPVGDFARIVNGSRERGKRRTRDLEKLDAASKQRVVPRMNSLESRAAAHEQRMNGLDSHNLAQDNRLTNHDRGISTAQATATNSQTTANSAYSRTTDLYEQLRLLTLRVENLERK